MQGTSALSSAHPPRSSGRGEKPSLNSATSVMRLPDSDVCPGARDDSCRPPSRGSFDPSPTAPTSANPARYGVGAGRGNRSGAAADNVRPHANMINQCKHDSNLSCLKAVDTRVLVTSAHADSPPTTLFGRKTTLKPPFRSASMYGCVGSHSQAVLTRRKSVKNGPVTASVENQNPTDIQP